MGLPFLLEHYKINLTICILGNAPRYFFLTPIIMFYNNHMFVRSYGWLVGWFVLRRINLFQVI